ELADVVTLIGGHKRDPDALGSSPAGASDAVHVGLAVMRRIEVDHVGDPGDVDSAGSDVGCDEYVDRARLESGERLLTLSLRLVAVHRHCVDAMAAQALHQP